MKLYSVLLGIDHAARDTHRRLHVRVKAGDALSAAIAAEEIGDRRVREPGVEYTHAMRVVELRPRPVSIAIPRALPLAA